MDSHYRFALTPLLNKRLAYLRASVQATAQHNADNYFMQQALQVAMDGAKLGEVPVGAVIVYQQQIIATGYNCPIATKDSTAHAEMVAIRSACQHFANYRLPQGCTLYVTLEPCTMCLGAIIHARVSRLVFGAYEPKAGVVLSQEALWQKCYFNHQLAVTGGVQSSACATVLRQFFQDRRASKRKLSGYIKG